MAESRRLRTQADHAAIIRAAEAWRQWLTGSLVRMQGLDDTEQALMDALAEARCGQCRRCHDCLRDAPFTPFTSEEKRTNG